MKFSNAALLVAIAAAGFGAGGYFYGAKQGPDDAQLAAAVEGYFTAHPRSVPAEPAEAATSTPAPLAEGQVTAIRQLIRDHLIANPEIVRDAIEELQRKEQAAAVAAQAGAITGEPRLFTSSRQVVLGNPKGDVTLVEFFDYNCGYCKRAHADMKRLIDEDKNLRVVLKEFPVLGDGSVEAAHVGAAVNLTAPDKYFEFHDALLTERGAIDGARALAVAGDIGLDTAAIKTAAESEEVKATIAEVYELAEKLSLTGTPSYVTQREVVVGAVGYDALKSKIKEAREACASTSC